MTLKSLAASFIFLFAIAHEHAHAEPSTVTVLLKEYGVGNIKPEVCEATADDSDALVTLSASDVKISVPEGAKRLILKLGAGPSFRERTVALHPAALRPTRKQVFVVERTRPRFNRDYLTQGLTRLDRERDPDAALALFDNAFRDSTRTDAELDSYEAILRYNYARALQQTCLRLEYDTCDDARQMLSAILETMNSSSQDRKVYESVHVTSALVQRALTDLASRDAKVHYGNFTAALASSDYVQAKSSIEAIEQAFAEDPKALKAQGLTAGRIAKDRAFFQSLSSGM